MEGREFSPGCFTGFTDMAEPLYDHRNISPSESAVTNWIPESEEETLGSVVTQSGTPG